MPFGLLSTGFAAKTLETQRSEMDADAKTKLGASVDTSDRSRLGKIIGIVAERLTTVWELASAIYTQWDPDAAGGDALEKLAAITGTLREMATKSTVTLTLTGIGGSATPAIGSRAAATSTGEEFATIERPNATFLTALVWVASTAYVVGNRVSSTVMSISRMYQCVVAGTSGTSAPTGESASVVDGTVTWAYLGRGTGSVDFKSESVKTGPIVAAARDITTIKTPVVDWLGVINILAAILGKATESDQALRVRRELEISSLGSSPLDAVRADILKVSGVTAVTVFHNVTDTTDADGVPPHSVEVLVEGGVDQTIADLLLDSVAAGIRTHGTTTMTSIDDSGNSHSIKFSRPTDVNIFVDVVLKKTSSYPVDGDTQVKNAIVALGNAESSGRNVVSTNVAKYVYTILGVHDVDPPEIGTSANPTTTTTVQISSRQKAKYDVARITVSSSTTVP